MKAILILLTIFTSISAMAEIDCRSLSGDSVVLCKQNKRILRQLRRLNLGGDSSALRACEINYCSYNGKADNSSYSENCVKHPNGLYWITKTVIVEARNRAHATEVFSNSGVVSFTRENDSKSNAIISILCD